MSDAGDGLAEVKRRFAEISEEQLQTTVENKDAVNTKRSTNQAVKILREYLEEKAQSNNWIVLTQWTGHVPRKVLCGSSEQKRGTLQEIAPHDDEVWIK